MPKGTIDIRRRIKSVISTKKVTKAMELVSAAKMRKAIAAVLATRPYAKYAWEMVVNVSSKTEKKLHPLLVERPVKKVGVILISSNRGLCGGFNNAVAQRAVEAIKQENNAEAEIISFGKKGRDIIMRQGKKIIADFTKQDITHSAQDVAGVSRLIIDEYNKGSFDKVYLVYTDFISTIKQAVRAKQILPFTGEIDFELGSTSPADKVLTENKLNYVYTFEPDVEMVLDFLLPRLLEVQIFQAVLESEASEHSVRMMTMRNASDAATDMIFDLSLTYNQARQSSITQEIAEISAGSAALE